VYPLLEKIQTEWEDLQRDPKYAPVHHAIEAGLSIMDKWYRKTDDTSIYFISHGWSYILWYLCANSMILVLDPTRKCTYLDVAWDEEWVEAAKDRMKDIVRSTSRIMIVTDIAIVFGLPREVRCSSK
jgi:hypothetical protein